VSGTLVEADVVVALDEEVVPDVAPAPEAEEGEEDAANVEEAGIAEDNTAEEEPEPELELEPGAATPSTPADDEPDELATLVTKCAYGTGSTAESYCVTVTIPKLPTVIVAVGEPVKVV